MIQKETDKLFMVWESVLIEILVMEIDSLIKEISFR
jgi:hypothetical protein